jgi:hypothetical protein
MRTKKFSLTKTDRELLETMTKTGKRNSREFEHFLSGNKHRVAFLETGKFKEPVKKKTKVLRSAVSI